MNFNPTHFLTLAEQLVQDGSLASEARARTAVGRAYYSAYLVSRERLKRNHSQLLTRISTNIQASDHIKVQLALKDLGKHDIAATLADIFTLRKNSDYDLHLRITDAQASRSIRQGRRVIQRVRREC